MAAISHRLATIAQARQAASLTIATRASKDQLQCRIPANGYVVAKPGNTGILRILRATRYSAQGFMHAWQHEAAFRQELGLTLVLVPAALWLGQTALERMFLIGCCLLVLIVELLNSAIEATVDRFGGAQHELSGRAKDLGSAAVCLSLAVVVLVWGTVAWQRFFV